MAVRDLPSGSVCIEPLDVRFQASISIDQRTAPGRLRESADAERIPAMGRFEPTTVRGSGRSDLLARPALELAGKLSVEAADVG